MRILGMWTLRMAPVLLLVIGLACSKPDAVSLVSAVESGDAEAVRGLLNAGADPNAVDRTSGDPVLMTAAKQRQVDMVQALLDAGADPDAVDGSSGNPVLVTAAGRGQVDMVQALLDAGADPDAVDGSSGNPVLVTAAGRGQVDMVQALLDAGADPDAVDGSSGNPVLVMAARQGRMFQVLLDAGADPDAVDGFSGDPVLMTAVERMQVDMVQALLEAGANPDVVNSFSPYVANTFWWILQEAVSTGDDEMVQILLDAGVDHPLATAVDLEQVDMVRALLDAGADPNAVDPSSGFPLLVTAVDLEQVDMVRALLDAGADPNAVDPSSGFPLLVTAVMYRVVINFGAPLKNVSDQVVPVRYNHLGQIRARLHVVLDRQNSLIMEEDINPYWISVVESGGEQLAWALLDAGADPDAALVVAVETGDNEMGRALLDAGADPNAALMIAVGTENEEMRRTLLDAGAGLDTALVVAVARLTSTVDMGGNPLVMEWDPYAEFETGEVVGALLDAGANPYAAFETAVTGVNLEIIRALLDAGADPNVSVTGVAPLKHAEIVGVNEGKLLSLWDTNIGYQGLYNEGNTLLAAAIRGGDGEVALALLDAGADPDAAALQEAVTSGEEEMVRALLDAGSDPNAGNDRGDPALVTAVMHRAVINVGVPLKDSADPKARELALAVSNKAEFETALELSEDRLRALLYAPQPTRTQADMLSVEAASLMVEAASLLTTTNPDRDAALVAAIEKRDKNKVRAMLDAGADPYAAAEAIVELNQAKVSDLLEAGTDLDSALVEAVGSGHALHPGTIPALLEAGANPFAAFEKSVTGVNIEIVRALLEAGADPNPAMVPAIVPSDIEVVRAPREPSADFTGVNAEIVRALLEAGADPNTVDDRGYPILLVALGYSSGVAELLLDHGISPDLVSPGSGYEWLIAEDMVSIQEGVLHAGDGFFRLMSGDLTASAELVQGLAESQIILAGGLGGFAAVVGNVSIGVGEVGADRGR